MLDAIRKARCIYGSSNSFHVLVDADVVEDSDSMADQSLRSEPYPRQPTPRVRSEVGGFRSGWDPGAKRDQGDKRGAQKRKAWF